MTLKKLLVGLLILGILLKWVLVPKYQAWQALSKQVADLNSAKTIQLSQGVTRLTLENWLTLLPIQAELSDEEGYWVLGFLGYDLVSVLTAMENTLLDNPLPVGSIGLSILEQKLEIKVVKAT